MTTKSALPVRILIVGGGFGGRDAAKRLAYRLPAGSEIVLIDRNDFLLYTPMLTEVAGRSVSPNRIQVPNHLLPRKVRVIKQEVVSADLSTRSVVLANGEELQGDHLIFALGSSTNFRDVAGAAEYGLTMKTLEDARRVRRQAEQNIHLARTASSLEERQRLCTFVVAGGGYTGVETIAALNDLVRDIARECSIPSFDLRLVLIESSKLIMSEMPDELAAYTGEVLSHDGIELRIGVAVQTVSSSSLTLTDGQVIETGMLIWDTGIVPNPFVDSLDCKKGKKHGIAVDSAFQVEGRSGVWAIGDCAEIPKPDGSGTFFEPTAQNATREGVHVADNILATIHGRAVKPFRYRQVGELAVIARHCGVAHVFGFQIKGLFGWLMWRAIYLAKLPGISQRLGVLLDWFRLAVGRRYVPTAGKQKRVKRDSSELLIGDQVSIQ